MEVALNFFALGEVALNTKLPLWNVQIPQLPFRTLSTSVFHKGKMSLEQSAQISFRALSTRGNYDLEQSALSKYI